MKQKDVALILVIAFISAILSFVVSNKLFITPTNRQQKVEVVDKIVSDFRQPNTKYFNSDGIDPTQAPQTDNGTNQNPFNGVSQ